MLACILLCWQMSSYVAIVTQPQFRPTVCLPFFLAMMWLELLRLVSAHFFRMACFASHSVLRITIGSGKTAAFLVPILSKLMGKARQLAAPRPNPTRYNPLTDRVRAEPLVLIACPTRELACQIFDECRRLCYRSMLRPCVAYGGGPAANQRKQLEMGCDILIATPGRLMDFLQDPKLLSLARLK